MIKAIGWIIFGFIFSWITFMMFSGFYLYKRDEAVMGLVAENKQLREENNKYKNREYQDPCRYRFNGICKKGQSVWYSNRVDKDMCGNCRLYLK